MASPRSRIYLAMPPTARWGAVFDFNLLQIGLRRQNLPCASQLSVGRGMIPGRVGPTPLCAVKIRFARTKFTLRGSVDCFARPKSTLRGHFSLCATKTRFARAGERIRARKIQSARANSTLRNENPVCADVFHFARPKTVLIAGLTRWRCIIRDSSTLYPH